GRHGWRLRLSGLLWSAPDFYAASFLCGPCPLTLALSTDRREGDRLRDRCDGCGDFADFHVREFHLADFEFRQRNCGLSAPKLRGLDVLGSRCCTKGLVAIHDPFEP